MTKTTAPEGITGAGLELWKQLHTALEFTMTEHQITVELCRTVTLCELLDKELAVTGPVVEGQRGLRMNPIAAQLRQQRLTAARLTASLNIPPADEAVRPRQRGGLRGVYRVQ